MTADSVFDGVIKILTQGQWAPDGSALNIEVGGHVCNVMGARDHPRCLVQVVADTGKHATQLAEWGWNNWGQVPRGTVFVWLCEATVRDSLAHYVSAVVNGAIIEDLWGFPEDSKPSVQFIKNADVTVA